MVKLVNKKMNRLELVSRKVTTWVGTPWSILAHTIFFIGIFALYLIGFGLDKILLVLTTAVSLEAIYLAIFIQMSVNRTTQSLEEVEEDIEDIQEDIEEDDVVDSKTTATLENIQEGLQSLMKEVESLKKSPQD